jgi:hypothetical protein
MISNKSTNVSISKIIIGTKAKRFEFFPLTIGTKAKHFDCFPKIFYPSRLFPFWDEAKQFDSVWILS